MRRGQRGMNWTRAFYSELGWELGNNGWQETAGESIYRLDWNRIVWTLRSLRHPQGLRAYLLFRMNANEELQAVSVRTVAPTSNDDPAGEEVRITRFSTWNAVLSILHTLRAWRARAIADRGELPPPLDPDDADRKFGEPEWEAATDAYALLHRGGKDLDDRKLRLFACACCRRLPILMEDDRNVRAIEVAEQYADGLVAKRELKKARKAARIPWLTSFEPYDEAVLAINATRQFLPARQQEHICSLLRDLTGNPFRPVRFKPSWLRANGGAVQQLAQAIHAEQRWEEMPILGDALEDAGCVDPTILDHCRRPGEHAVGCWLIDAVLGRA
jgi:hypothetical protein